jgi:periplasmic protein TonB
MGEVVALAGSRRQVSIDDVELQPIEMGTPVPRRIATAMAASVALHVLLLAALLSLPPAPPLETPIVVFPVSLVSVGGAGGGEGGGTPDAIPSPPPPPVPSEPVAEVAPPTPVPAPAPVVRPKVTKPAKAPRSDTSPGPVANAPSEGTAGGVPAPSGGGTGAGGGGGAGFSAASPAYGVNPQPPYPTIARRLKLEGTVVLRVFVAVDGTPERVDVLQSSGHDSLDGSAVDTVRTRWRFLPARRNGIPVEDSVQVPIRFRQTAG